MRNLTLTGSALSILAASAVASAQSTLPDLTPTNISIRAGASWAVNGPLRSSGNMWFAAGVDYPLSTSFIPGATTYFSFDWIGKSGSGGHGNMFPICVNERFYMGSAKDQPRPYAFIGAGIIIMDVTSSQTVGGVRMGLGCNFTQSVFGEVTLLLGGQVDGIQPTSVGVYVGYRF